MIGGVALGLAAHFGVDVVVVRVMFVVAAFVPFFGFGALVYLGFLVLMPTPERAGISDRVVAGEPVDRTGGRGAGFWVGLVIVACAGSWLLASIGAGWGFGQRGFLVPLLLIGLGVALWVDAERRGSTSAPAGRATAWDDAAATGTVATDAVVTDAVVTDPAVADVAATDTVRIDEQNADAEGTDGAAAGSGASWQDTTRSSADGAVPPPPTRPAHPAAGWTPPPVPKRRRSPLGRITFALALLVSGGLWALGQADGIDVAPTQVLGSAVLVLGLGLLVGSVVGRARWLALPALLLVPVLLFGMVLRGLDLPLDAGFGDRVIHASEASEVPLLTELGAGTVRLDLAELTAAPDETVVVRIGGGELVVVVPDDAGLTGLARAEAGQLDLLGSITNGVSVERSLAVPPEGGAPTFDLDLRVGAGQIVIVRERHDTLGGFGDDRRRGIGRDDPRGPVVGDADDGRPVEDDEADPTDTDPTDADATDADAIDTDDLQEVDR